MSSKSCYVYILASKQRGTLYIGSTSDLVKRVWQHKNKVCRGFTAKYQVDQLVYFEVFSDIYEMAHREKRIKEWKRIWKIRLIEEKNPNWQDLYYSIT